jgi:hypothetical protein
MRGLESSLSEEVVEVRVKRVARGGRRRSFPPLLLRIQSNFPFFVSHHSREHSYCDRSFFCWHLLWGPNNQIIRSRMRR